ncbi:MAG: hypothetical protein RLY47_544 [Candidatus Parcubacteria bacterium]|jgi:D-alanine-D-alanine ligase
MSKLRVAVLRGGPSNEYDVSLKTGATVLKHLDREKYQPLDVFIDKNASWHVDGVVTNPLDLRHRVDVAWNALHGSYGEDGEVQRLLESIDLPYTGSGVVASAVAMHKAKAKEVFVRHGLSVAPGIEVELSVIDDGDVREIFRTLPPPYIVKPVSSGSSVGMSVAHSISELHDALMRANEQSSNVLIESMVRGREATCGIIDGYRGEKFYALMPIEIVPPTDASFFDYSAKYSGTSQEICPGRFSREETNAIQEAARTAHEALGARHYSRSDFIVTPKGKPYILETNTLPGLTEESLVPKALAAAGCSLKEFLDHVIKQAARS